MLFNLDKCTVVHFGFANEGMEVTRCWVSRRVKGIQIKSNQEYLLRNDIIATIGNRNA